MNKETCESSNIEDNGFPKINHEEFVKASKRYDEVKRKDHVAHDAMIVVFLV